MSLRELLESGANVSVTVKLDDLRTILKEAAGSAAAIQQELSPEMMQRREGESPEEHIARITALINKAAEAMAIALVERKRRMEARSREIG